jgi:hypothetical protein
VIPLNMNSAGKTEIGNGYVDYFETVSVEMKVQKCVVVNAPLDSNEYGRYECDSSSEPTANQTLAAFYEVSPTSPFKLSFLTNYENGYKIIFCLKCSSAFTSAYTNPMFYEQKGDCSKAF